jgi:hypothetical protein
MALYPVLNRATALVNPTTGATWDCWVNVAPPVSPAGGRPQLANAIYAVVDGTFGAGGTLVIEGSDDGTSFATIRSLTAALPLTQIATQKRFVRANVTAGDGTTSLNVSILSVLNTP